MAVTLTSAATTVFSGQVVQAFTQAAYFKDDYAVTISQKNKGVTQLFPTFGTFTGGFTDDGTDLSGGTAYSVGNVNVTPELPLKFYATLKYNDLETYESYVPSNISRRLGMQLGLHKSDCLAMAVAKSAWNRAASAGRVNVGGNADWGQATDANYGVAMKNAAAKLANAAVSLSDAVALVTPYMYAGLRNLAQYAGAEFLGNRVDNISPNNTEAFGNGATNNMKVFGIEIIPVVNRFWGTNATAASDLPTFAQYDSRYTEGVVFSKQALGQYIVEQPNGRIDDVAFKSIWLLQSRAIFGAAALQTSGMFVIETGTEH